METETKNQPRSPRRGILTAIVVVAGLWTLLHVYVGQRLLAQTPLAPGWRLVGWVGVLLLVLAPFVALVAGRTERLPAKRGLEVAGFTAMGLSSLLIVFALAGDALHARAWLGVGGFQLAVVGGAVAVLVMGLWLARRPATVRVVDVPITGLPSDLEGFRIAQLSDLHVGPTLKRDFVERVVDTTNGLEPDVIALTGDVADGFPPALRNDVAPLAGLVAPHGKFFVTGNHEYYWDAAGWVRELQGLGFSALVNGHQVIQRGTGRIVLAGVTDLSSGGLPGHTSDPAAAVAGAPASDVRVLLAHQPKSAFAARAAGYDLQLSGHTHGGQYFPFNLLVRLFQPFVAGLHRLEAMWLYVSRGTGYWGPPLRLGAPAEITLIQLVRA
ncbi:MAG: serine/threonine protein phosphatase [Gemmatimonadetes bacterium]|nr:MAG: serine/threonine protein phosphatase [Gemmatimonadota bacterium]